MKSVLFLTLWAFFAQILPLAAQTNTPELIQDTLVIRLEGRNQIHITSQSLKKLTEYERADSLKQFFFTDLQKALSAGVFTEMPQRLHYLVSPDGKRRLKAEINPEPEKFDLKREANRLRLDLPQNHYTVYDLKNDVQMHFFMEDSASLELVENARIKPALQEIAQEEKKLKKHYKYTVEKQGEVYTTKGSEGNKLDMITAEPIFGVGLIGNQLTPVLGATLKLTLHDKYALPKYQFGLHYYGFNLPAEPGYRFRDVNLGSITDFSFGVNASRKEGNTRWIGIQAGMVNEIHNNLLPDKALKTGIFISQGTLTYGIDVIKTDRGFKFDGDQSGIYMFTIKTNF
ncbi:MAG: hypothetical protein EOO01_29450 [Chitinophagaceae bacterium]|nr:MAG: hypothetical protein EOO01_29450 [Chitinophagaceae bacterium]